MRLGGLDLGGLLRDQLAGLVGREVLAEELRHQAQPHRELVGLPVVHREHPVPVVGEVGELPHVVPHPLIGGVEQVRAVLVDLDAGLRLGFGVGVATDVRAPLDDEHALVELGSHALGDGQAEEIRSRRRRGRRSWMLDQRAGAERPGIWTEREERSDRD